MSKETLKNIWTELYGQSADTEIILLDFLNELDQTKKAFFSNNEVLDTTWYKNAIVYSTYADLFNKDINGLKEKLGYLKNLGINCIWLLPILESPMKDAGFDISDYESIRPELLGLPEDASPVEKDEVFNSFIQAAHEKGIRIIFDIAMNHCSIEHKWFKEARSSKTSSKRDYFIWHDTPQKYQEARIIFKGMCDSNWEFDPISEEYFFHRFFEIQPDLNYRNKEVLINMTKVLVEWKKKGIDGFRADAVPYIWKEEGTICENLYKTHLVVKFFRAVLDYLQPGSLLLAEACQPPKEVVTYFGDNNECNGAYHFPVMPHIYKAMAEGLKDSIEMAMAEDYTPPIPKDCQWFMFLRCHDELTLEMVTPKEREFIYSHYAKQPNWDFRKGEGISSRLSELLDLNLNKIMLANSIMFTLLGTPIVFYGDEFGKRNDEDFYEKMFKETGYADSRYLARGTIDWQDVEAQLSNKDSLGYQIFHALKHMIFIRSQHKAFSRGTLTFIDCLNQDQSINPHVLAYKREFEDNQVYVIQNLSDVEQQIISPIILDSAQDILGQDIKMIDGLILLKPKSYLWL